MQHIQEKQCDEEGCFVYRVIKKVAVRSTIDVGDESRTDRSYKAGDLVSVDLRRPSRFPGSTNGPFLRLSDCSGWLFERKYGDTMMEQVPVTTGLWVLYADNDPVGIGLRRHPFDDSPKVEPKVTFKPMQQIYCDRRVVSPNGVTAYRVQGTEGWVFDKRLYSDGSKRFMLLPETSVKTGLFVYQALSNCGIRTEPTIREDSKTGAIIQTEELTSCNAIRQSPDGSDNGPFVRLTDGSGWLFERKNGVFYNLLKPVPVEEGHWKFRVVNKAGIALRRQPIDNNMKYNTVYSFGQQVTCDRKVVQPSTSISFYRVHGTEGWVFDQREGNKTMMDKLATYDTTTDTSASTNAWHIEYIRGIAAAYELEEVQYNPTSRVISFQSQDGVKINVYYTTRTIGTALNHPRQGKTQLFRRNCSNQELIDIFQDPRTHTSRGYYRKRTWAGEAIVPTIHGKGIVVEQEEELRNTLLEIDKELQQLNMKKGAIQKSLKQFDDKRAEEATAINACRNQRVAELQEAAEAKKRALQEAAEAKRRQQDLTCPHCQRTFVDKHARDQHVEAAHGCWECPVCWREFNSKYSLSQHCNAVGHW